MDKSYWHDRWNRRGVLQGVAVGGAGLAATTLLACNTTSQPQQQTTNTGTSSTAPQPKRGGLLRTSTSSGVGRLIHLDPMADSPVYAQHLRLIYQGLLGYEPLTREIEPQIGQKWEQPSPTEYVFTLQPGIKFHNKAPVNGRDLTVEEVIFSFERARSPKRALHLRVSSDRSQVRGGRLPAAQGDRD
jgi:ABC-type transport system substrate-binding protein